MRTTPYGRPRRWMTAVAIVAITLCRRPPLRAPSVDGASGGLQREDGGEQADSGGGFGRLAVSFTDSHPEMGRPVAGSRRFEPRSATGTPALGKNTATSPATPGSPSDPGGRPAASSGSTTAGTTIVGL